MVPVAGFLNERVWNGQAGTVSVQRCEACDFTFYCPRMTPKEEARLYAGYRGEEYQKQRQKHEPGYTAEFNAHFESAEEYGKRRDTVRGILMRHLYFSDIRNVLDYGGGTGELISGLIPGTLNFVYDLAERELPQGVWRVKHPSSCKSDLIVASNILEHAGNPAAMMVNLCEATPGGSHIFCEVPQETVAPAMHEHVSYFSEKALRKLVEQHFAVVASGIDGAIWCLAKAK